MKLSEIVDTKRQSIEKTLIRYGLWLANIDPETGEILDNPNYKPHRNHSSLTKIDINNDGTVSMGGLINFSNSSFKKLPIKFKKVIGQLNCGDCNKLETLENFPEEIDGELKINNCLSLTSFIGGPKSVKKLDANQCASLVTLDGMPECDGDINLSSCHRLKSLKGLPDIVNGNLNISFDRALTTLEGMPTEIRGHLIMDNLRITSLDYLPEKINGDLVMSGCRQVFNLLALFDVEGIKKLEINDKPPKVIEILNRHLENPDRDEGKVECRQELKDAGFGEYARLK